MRPTDCERCRRRFMNNYALQAEMRHLAAKLGPRTAEAELNERLAEEHASHKPKRWKSDVV